MTLTLTRQKENLENYIRSKGYSTKGMNLLGNQVILEKPIIDSYEEVNRPKELVDLVNTLETLTEGGEYEVNNLSSEVLEEVNLERSELPNIDKKTIKVNYSVRSFSGYLTFSQEQIDDGQYNLSDYLGRKIVKLERRTRNKEIGKILQTAEKKTVTDIDELKSIISLISPERKVSIIMTQSLFDILSKIKDTTGNYLLKTDKAAGTTETFYVDNFLIVDDTTLGSKGDKHAFVGDLENFVTLFDRKKPTLSWSSSGTIFGTKLVLHTRFDAKKIEADCGYLVAWN
ncbi:Capsid protein [Streptococcus suis]|uniref:phage major capsid protein n=1 Tax=Streptococcus suis TaxID=1307 RepID=UPI0005D18CA7|nr:phage major capsid protein [Streptococcus suis]CYY63123.1 Capsid protein [Streptococcus suis]